MSAVTVAFVTSYQAGQTALVVKVPEAEPVVSTWRSRYDAAAAAGVPAHITVLYPFLNHRAVTAGVLAQLQALFAGHRAFEVQLAQARRFPGVLYLAPVPDTGLRASRQSHCWPSPAAAGGRSTASAWPAGREGSGQMAVHRSRTRVCDGRCAAVMTSEAGIMPAGSRALTGAR